MHHPQWTRESRRLRALPRAESAPIRPLRARSELVDPTAAVAHLVENVQLALDDPRSAGVHQVRVTCRRLMVLLQVSGRRTLLDDLRWLRGAAAEVRDLEVATHRTLPSEVIEWFEGQRSAARARLRHEIESTRASGLLQALRWLEPVSLNQLEMELVRLRRQVARRGEALEVVDDDPRRERERLHDLRRALRRLRYTLSWIGEDPAALRRLQSALGGLNDLEQLDLRLEDYPYQARIVELRADVEARAMAAHSACLAAWCDARDRVRALMVEE